MVLGGRRQRTDVAARHPSKTSTHAKLYTDLILRGTGSNWRFGLVGLLVCCSRFVCCIYVSCCWASCVLLTFRVLHSRVVSCILAPMCCLDTIDVPEIWAKHAAVRRSRPDKQVTFAARPSSRDFPSLFVLVFPFCMSALLSLPMCFLVCLGCLFSCFPALSAPTPPVLVVVHSR